MQNAFRNQIILGDCCSVMQQMPRECVDLVLTDPPYLVGYKDREGRSIQNDTRADWLVPAFAQAFRVLKRDSLCVSFYGWTKTDLFFHAWKAAGFQVVGHITFPKRYASSSRFMRYAHEGAYLLAKGHPPIPANPINDVIDFCYSGNKLHPTQKPVEALTQLINTFTRPGDMVLDPFAGSGSTLVAAQSINRFYCGIEIDPKFHTIAQNRIQRFLDHQRTYMQQMEAA